MKIIMFTTIIIILLLIVVFFLVGNYFYNIALNPKTSKTFVLGEAGKETQEQTESRVETENWVTKNSKDVYITATNNGILKIHAYEVRNL